MCWSEDVNISIVVDICVKEKVISACLYVPRYIYNVPRESAQQRLSYWHCLLQAL